MDEQTLTQVQKMVDDSLDKSMMFSTRKFGDTPTDANQLTPKSYVDGIASVINASIVGIEASIIGLGDPNIFCDGSDGFALIDGVSSINAASITVAGSVYTMFRDGYYTGMSISSNVFLRSNSYKVYGNGTLTINSSRGIQNDGNRAVSVFGGNSIIGGTLPGALEGGPGGSGASATNNGMGNPGNNSIPGASVLVSIGSSSLGGLFEPSGGKGGLTTNFPIQSLGGSTGSIGTAVPATILPHIVLADLAYGQYTTVFTRWNGSAGAPGGGGAGAGSSDGGASPNSGAGGAGGGAGGTGGNIAVYFNRIVNNATAGISAQGGAAAPGLNGDNALDRAFPTGGGGGGGGGTGGTGGTILVVFATSVQGGTYSVDGGVFGAGGDPGQPGSFAGGTVGLVGKPGNNGAAGKIWLYQI